MHTYQLIETLNPFILIECSLLIHTGTTIEFNWLRALSPFGMEDMNIFLRYLNLFLDTVFPIRLPNFKFVALTSSSINSGQKQQQIIAI